MRSRFLSLDNRARRSGCFLGGLFALAFGGFALWLIPPAWMIINDVTTGQTPAYPDLQPRRYNMPPAQTLQLASAVIAKFPSWRVVRRDSVAGTLDCEVKVSIGIFTDDVTVTVRPVGTAGDQSEVVIRSRSRVGRGDLGENARHIRLLQAAMDDKLPLL